MANITSSARLPVDQKLWDRSLRLANSIGTDYEWAAQYYTNHGGKWFNAALSSSEKRRRSPLDRVLWGRAKRLAQAMFDDYPSGDAMRWAAAYYSSHGGKWAPKTEMNHTPRNTVSPVISAPETDNEIDIEEPEAETPADDDMEKFFAAKYEKPSRTTPKSVGASRKGLTFAQWQRARS